MSLMAATAVSAQTIITDTPAYPKASAATGMDITPAHFNFNQCDAFCGFLDNQGARAWNMDNNWMLHNYQQLENGGIMVLGGEYANNATKTADLLTGCNIIDFGGSCGKVLCINASGTGFNDELKAQFGEEVNIPSMSTGGGFPLFFWMPDPKAMAHYALDGEGTGQAVRMRVRFEMNIWCKLTAADAEIVGADGRPALAEWWVRAFECYANDDQNNVKPAGANTANGIAVTPDDFKFAWCEKDATDPTDVSLWGDGHGGEQGTWNPYRWMTYEMDVPIPNDGKADGVLAFCTRLKNEYRCCGNSALLIRKIEWYIPDAATEHNWGDYGNSRGKFYNYYLDMKAPKVVATGIAGVQAGNEVLAPTDEVYNLNGARVATVKAGQTSQLPKGIYVVKNGNKAKKVVVK